MGADHDVLVGEVSARNHGKDVGAAVERLEEPGCALGRRERGLRELGDLADQDLLGRERPWRVVVPSGEGVAGQRPRAQRRYRSGGDTALGATSRDQQHGQRDGNLR